MQGLQGAAASAAAELGELRLPGDVHILDLAGTGTRAVTFKGVFRGEAVALKIYRPDVVARYRRKYDLNIAVYEMSQNRKFRQHEELFPFSAKPIMVFGHDGRLSLCFIQEFIDGLPLMQLASEQRGLPASVLEAGDIIARAGNQAGLPHLDLGYRDVLVRRQSGRWVPVVHDFNLPPDGGRGAIAGVFRSRPPDNLQQVSEWYRHSEECHNAQRVQGPGTRG
jgi:predicted Ser/Thr protein kinase